MRFSDIEGYDRIKQRFIKLANVDSLPHCQLLFGDKCTPIFSLALAFTKYIFCKDPVSHDSCGSCMGCNKLTNLTHPDLYFVVPYFSNASNDGKKHRQFVEFLSNNQNPTIEDWSSFLSAKENIMSIVKEDAHSLSSWESMKAIDANYKVCIIWLPEYMTVAAANSFLKILEEPHISSIFLLLSYDKDRILPTITSRAQHIYISPPRNPFKLEPIVSIGSEPDNFPKFVDWVRSCYKQDFLKLCTMSEEFQKISLEEQKSFLKYSIRMLKHICILEKSLSFGTDVYEVESIFLQNLSKSIKKPSINLIELIKSIDKSITALDKNANSKVLFFNLSLEFSW